ncbi:hypothetical protein OE88DRAFT_862569 [Heliocybe sulcata]|uniref:Uncharacterized protein n=1 Tax=Heliocybe sulcata TaxID=5364 RepID=A0A5C3MR10_9AGAM|nr:hypothetical protein OE88DRAFT_862569 [Heliocybe sulcata]
MIRPSFSRFVFAETCEGWFSLREPAIYQLTRNQVSRQCTAIHFERPCRQTQTSGSISYHSHHPSDCSLSLLPSSRSFVIGSFTICCGLRAILHCSVVRIKGLSVEQTSIAVADALGSLMNGLRLCTSPARGRDVGVRAEIHVNGECGGTRPAVSPFSHTPPCRGSFSRL